MKLHHLHSARCCTSYSFEILRTNNTVKATIYQSSRCKYQPENTDRIIYSHPYVLCRQLKCILLSLICINEFTTQRKTSL